MEGNFPNHPTNITGTLKVTSQLNCPSLFLNCIKTFKFCDKYNPHILNTHHLFAPNPKPTAYTNMVSNRIPSLCHKGHNLNRRKWEKVITILYVILFGANHGIWELALQLSWQHSNCLINSLQTQFRNFKVRIFLNALFAASTPGSEIVVRVMV